MARQITTIGITVAILYVKDDYRIKKEKGG